MAAPLAFPIQDRFDPVSDSREITMIVKALVKAMALWKVSNTEAADLLDVPIATWNRMKSGHFKGTLDRDKVTRASLLIGICKGLRLLFNGPLTYGWVKQPNAGPLFHGHPPLDYMTRGIPALMAVRHHIDALRGGS